MHTTEFDIAHQCLTTPTLSPTPTYDAQIAWEHDLVDRGIRRYRAALTRVSESGAIVQKSMVDTEPGQIIASSVIVPMVEAIQKRQAFLIGMIENRSGDVPSSMGDGDWVLLTMPAEVIGTVTVLHALSVAPASSGGVNFTGCSVALGTKIKAEYDFRRWGEAEREAEKKRKAAGVTEWVPNLFDLMRSRNKTVDTRVFRKWSKKAPLFNASAWTKTTRVQVGALLLGLLVECDGWFKVFTGPVVAGRQHKMFAMTAEGLAFVQERHARNELERPYLLPMLCEPMDYCYQEVA